MSYSIHPDDAHFYYKIENPAFLSGDRVSTVGKRGSFRIFDDAEVALMLRQTQDLICLSPRGALVGLLPGDDASLALRHRERTEALHLLGRQTPVAVSV